MSALEWVALVVAGLLCIYLVYALLRGERL